MVPAGLRRTKRSVLRASVLVLPLIGLLTMAAPEAADAAGPVPAPPAPAVKPGAKPAPKPTVRRRRRRRSVVRKPPVAAAKPPVKPGAPVAKPPVRPVLPPKPVAVVKPGVKPAPKPVTPVVARTVRRRRTTRVAHPFGAGVTYRTAKVALSAPTITPGGNLVEPLSNGFSLSTPRLLLLSRFGKPQEKVGTQYRYTNFGVEYLPNNSDKISYVALQKDVRLNCKLGTGSTKAEAEKLFGKLDHHNDVIYQKYLLHFAEGKGGIIDAITVSPAPGRPSL